MSAPWALETRCAKVSISTSAPQPLAWLFHSLLTILHIEHPVTMQSCSKGSRGLFVPLRVIGIFTDTTISPSSRLRQCPDHYTIRAEGTLGSLRYSFGGDHPSQTTHQAVSSHPRVRNQMCKGQYFNVDSTMTGVTASLSPDYPTHRTPGFNAKLQ